MTLMVGFNTHLVRATSDDILSGRLNAYEALRAGKIILLQARAEVQNLRDAVFGLFRTRAPEHVAEVEAFLADPRAVVSDAALAKFVDTLRIIRDLCIQS